MQNIRILDLFCGIGGAARGFINACQQMHIQYEIIGIDRENFSRFYPAKFIQMDITQLTVEYIRNLNVDFIWASPPCQHYSISTNRSKLEGKTYPDLVKFTRDLLLQTNLPFVIENVIACPLVNPIILYGDMFNVSMRRGRKFELHGFTITQLPPRNKQLPNYRLISGGGGWIRKDQGDTSIRMTLEEAITLFNLPAGITLQHAGQIVIPQMSQFLLTHFLTPS